MPYVPKYKFFVRKQKDSQNGLTMKHETINSIVGVLGLFIGTVTAVSEFWPEADQLQVVTEGRIDSGQPVTFTGLGLLHEKDAKPSPAFGPVSWKIRLHNGSDRTLSIVDYKVFQLTENGAKIWSSAHNYSIAKYGQSTTEQLFPFSISAHEASAFIISLMVPFKKESAEDELCIEQQATIKQLEKCYYQQGRDLFGNFVETVVYDPPQGERLSVKWSETTFSPSFIVEFETANGSTFSTLLSYYPF